MVTAKLAIDTPQYMLDLLDAVDYEKITETQYKKWVVIIKNNIGNYIKKRTVAPILIDVPYPINPMFCRLINQYDFNTLSVAKKTATIIAAKKWANKNLPLKNSL